MYSCLGSIINSCFFRIFLSGLPSFGEPLDRDNTISLSDGTMIDVVFVYSDTFFYSNKYIIATGFMCFF